MLLPLLSHTCINLFDKKGNKNKINLETFELLQTKSKNLFKMNPSWSTASKRSIAAMIIKNSARLPRRIYVNNNNNNNNIKIDSSKKHSCPNALEESALPKIIIESADSTYDVDEDDNQQSNMNNNNNNNNTNNYNNIDNNNSNINSNDNDNNNNYLNKCNNREATSGFVDAAKLPVEKKIRHKKQKRMNRLQNCENTVLDMTGKEEAKNLQVEFEWVLRSEVHAILKQLRVILIECAHRFPVPLYENEGKKTEKFVLSVSPEQLKASVTLTGDTITQADICFKLAKAPHHIQRTSILQESPWKLQQVQDAANYLQQAINHIDDVHENCHFKTSDEVLHVVGNILEALRRGRTSLVIPKKKSIDELIKGRNMKSLAPNLSEDLAVSFYLQSHKLIIAIYQLTNIQGTMRFDSYQAEASVQWLNEVLFLFTTALKICQQLKDKISVFSLYKDFTVGTHPPSSAFTYLN